MKEQRNYLQKARSETLEPRNRYRSGKKRTKLGFNFRNREIEKLDLDRGEHAMHANGVVEVLEFRGPIPVGNKQNIKKKENKRQ